jgi:hypothetical protein
MPEPETVRQFVHTFIDRAFYEVVSCQPPFFKESFLPPNERGRGDYQVKPFLILMDRLPWIRSAFWVFVWPGFNKRKSAELLSVSVILNRTPYALCAKPAWWKPPHLQNRVHAPARSRASPTIRKLLKVGSDAFSIECLLANGSFNPCSWRQNSEFDVTPQIDHQSSSQGNDTDSPYPWPTAAKSLLIPLTQLTLWLISQPTPGDLNRHGAHSTVASAADALIARAFTALIRHRR